MRINVNQLRDIKGRFLFEL